jgi:carboxymethylenebutenolidase
VGRLVEFESVTGPTPAYLAVPTGGSGPGVVVVQEWWGLVDHIKDVCDRFAGEGFVALAPDLYGGEQTGDADRASRKMQELNVADAARDLRDGVRFLLDRSEVTGERVGVVGYCMGGSLALVTADTVADQVGAVDSYYGVFWYGEPELDGIQAPVVLRVGTADEFVPVSKVEGLADHIRHHSGTSVEVATYEGAGHAFFNDTGANYDQEAAGAAWQDTLAFFRHHLTGTGGAVAADA